jgi:hypothetical protein
MPEVVPIETAPESLVPESQPQGSPEADATPAFDEATWKKRLAGKDQALTAAQRERDALKAERDALSQWKAEQEQASMTELQKLQAERDRLQAEAQQAKAEAAAVRLRAQYPLAAEILGDDLSKFDEVRVAEIDGRLAKEKAAEEAPEPRVDPNSPRRTPIARPPADDLSAAMQALTAAGNPFFDELA